jgi:hypothetical protein
MKIIKKRLRFWLDNLRVKNHKLTKKEAQNQHKRVSKEEDSESCKLIQQP